MVSSRVTAAMDGVLGPILFFLGGMAFGSTMVAIAWYIAHIRYYKPKQDEEKAEAEQRENDVEEIETDSCPVIMSAACDSDKGDYLLSDDKSQIISVVDFRAVPRNEGARQQARRDLVIQMLIAESLSN